MPVQRLTPPKPDSQAARPFIQREGATCRNGIVGSDSHLEIGHVVV